MTTEESRDNRTDPGALLAWEAAVEYPSAREWYLDSYCAKHNGFHLQNEDGGTELVGDQEVARAAVRLLNENPASVHEEATDD